MSCGIYKIINKVNGKFYLGSSKDIETRWDKHIYDLKNNRHHSVHLQRAWIKYGEENFIFEILENTSTEMLLEREQTLLDTLRPFDDNNGYNMSRTSSGGDLLSYHPDKNAIVERIKETIKNNINSMTVEERKKRWSQPLEENPNWKGGKSYFTCPLCNGEFKNQKQKCCMKCRDKTGSKNPFYGKKHSDETKEKLRETRLANGNKFNIQKLSIEVDGIIYSSFSEAAKALGCVTASIRNRLNNPSKFPNYHLVTQP